MEPKLPIELYNSRTDSILKVPYVVGLSIIGMSHIKNGLPCQDSCKFDILKSGNLVIALADGLGSAKKSDVGSSIAVNSVIHFFKEIENRKKIETEELHELLKNAIEIARIELDKKSNLEQVNIHDFACTLIIVLVIEKKVIVAQIGDGAVIVKTQNRYELISAPEDQEYVNEVTPLTSRFWEEALRISLPFSNVEHIAAFTDGCQRAMLTKKDGKWNPNDEFLEAFFLYFSKLLMSSDAKQFIKDIIESKKFSEISDDDKTLVVAVL